MAWTVFIASCSVIIGNNIRDCVLLYYPESHIVGHPICPGWFSTSVALLTLYLGFIFNTVLAKWLQALEKMMLVVHLVHFLVIIVVLLVMSPWGHANDVLLTFNNGGNVSQAVVNLGEL
jgi:choline transport protein